MPSNVTAATLPLKGVNSTDRDPAQVLRECLSARRVTVEDMADRWSCSKTVAQRILSGERPMGWRRFALLPDAVRADFCHRYGATLEPRPARSVDGETLDVTVQLGRLTDEVRSAIADGQLSEDERRRIRDEAAKLLGEVQDVLVAVS